jgi:Na+/H+ antiporter NhaD/arsenite permease-like protein
MKYLPSQINVLITQIDIIVLFPFHIPIFIPRKFVDGLLKTLSDCRIISPRQNRSHDGDDNNNNGKIKPFVRLNFPLNFVTAPLIADLFLLAIRAIGRTEVSEGTAGSDGIYPYNIMIFFLTLAYIAISIDASGLIRWLAFKVLQKGGGVGHRLFFYLYAFFFTLGSFIGNDPIILSGTAFLAYMTRVSSNIVHPRAWIHTQFAVANIASAILVSSNPTNLVIAGAFGIRFINYTANMIVPVLVTAIVLFPFLLYIVFAEETLIPLKIEMHQLTQEAQDKVPVNPNIPDGRGVAEEEEKQHVTDEQGKMLSLEEIMNPFIDRKGAGFGAFVMSATLITLLVINASDQKGGIDKPVYWITLPGAFVMLCWDIGSGWINRKETREIARIGREEKARFRARLEAERLAESQLLSQGGAVGDIPLSWEQVRPETEHLAEAQPQSEKSVEAGIALQTAPTLPVSDSGDEAAPDLESSIAKLVEKDDLSQNGHSTSAISTLNGRQELNSSDSGYRPQDPQGTASSGEDLEKRTLSNRISAGAARPQQRATVVSLMDEGYRWCQETFPTVTAVLSHLPYALLPFAFSMFVLVEALVSKGWVPVFAYGWDHVCQFSTLLPPSESLASYDTLISLTTPSLHINLSNSSNAN